MNTDLSNHPESIRDDWYANGSLVFTDGLGRLGPVILETGSAEQAQRIVRAVNNFDDMLAALKSLVVKLERGAFIRADLKAARAAITKAVKP